MRKGPYATYRLQFKDALSQLDTTPIVIGVGDCEFLVNRVKAELEQRLAKKGYLIEGKTEQQAYQQAWQEFFSERGLFQSQITYTVAVKADTKLKSALSGITSATDSANRLLLFCKQKSLSAGITKELKRLGGVQIACKDPYDSEAKAVITDLAKSAKLSLSQSAIDVIARHLGANPALISNELSKLSLIFADHSAELSADDVAPHIGAIKEDQAFTLESLLLQGKVAKAQLLLSQLLAKGDAPLMVLAIVTGFFRKLHSIHLCPAHDRAGVLSSLRVPPFIHRDYFAAINRYSEPICGRALAQCQAADQRFKSSPADPELVLSSILAALPVR